jgi:hypothetical protein
MESIKGIAVSVYFSLKNLSSSLAMISACVVMTSWPASSTLTSLAELLDFSGRSSIMREEYFG